MPLLNVQSIQVAKKRSTYLFNIYFNCPFPVISVPGEFLPSQVGLPLQSNKATFMMLEVHYDNPTLRRGEFNHQGDPNSYPLFAILVLFNNGLKKNDKFHQTTFHKPLSACRRIATYEIHKEIRPKQISIVA